MELSATEKTKHLAHTGTSRIRALCHLRPLIALLALSLSGCGDKPPQQPAAGPPPVTVAQPSKRTVTDWDEFTGRFEAVDSSPASSFATVRSLVPATSYT